MEEIPKLDFGYGSLSISCKPCELAKMETQNSDQINEKSDSFVVDIESISKGIISHSKIKRSLARKGSLRSTERKTNSRAVSEKDTNTIISASSSPRAAPSMSGASTPEKVVLPLAATAVAVGATNHPFNPQPQNQITISTSNGGTVTTESRLGKKSSFKRSSSPWGVNPRRILLFFATLSSMGTILLIYFTLSMSKVDGDVLDW
ncbi:hypothetical protein RJ641_001989 [Dillenia turbinata]|uniref:Transmembrane protein n=1 Tax=Dillenia turbinata TaxID=194707 RepID=A0AAN8VDM3_9MAGN